MKTVDEWETLARDLAASGLETLAESLIGDAWREAHALGRAEGYAEGVEASAKIADFGAASGTSYAPYARRLAAGIRALRALLPSALGRMAPGVEGEPASGYGLHPAIVATPSPATPDRDMGWATCEECSQIVESERIAHVVCVECADLAPSPARRDADENAAWDAEAARRRLTLCDVDVGAGYCCTRRKGHPSPHLRVRAPSPKEDAPRCEACGHPEDAHNSAIANGCCHGEWERCGCFRFVGGTGRSTTGGGR